MIDNKDWHMTDDCQSRQWTNYYVDFVSTLDKISGKYFPL